MLKFLRSLRAEHKKLWHKRSALLSLALIFSLSWLLTGTGAQLSRWSDSFPATPVNKILTDVMYRDGPAVSEKDFTKHYSDIANKAAERLIEINAEIEFTTGREHYSLARERSELLYYGGIARYRVQNNVTDTDSSSGRLIIFTMWLITPFIAVFSVLYASDIFAGEYERGTLRLMLCRPVTRIRQYLAKLTTALLYSAALLCGSLLFSSISAVSVYGNDTGRAYLGLLNGSVYQTTWGDHITAAAVCCFSTVLCCVTFCAFLGNITHSRTASAIVPLLVLAVGICFGPWIGASDSVIPGLTLFCCIDLATPLCGFGCSNALGFSEYAASLGIHVVVFIIGAYAAFRNDIA